jgi:hypothetical protein
VLCFFGFFGLLDFGLFLHHPKGSQLSSVTAAVCAEESWKVLNLTTIKPTIHPRESRESWLYNTDGIIFDGNGFPVILINEHLNRFANIDRPFYHQSTDVVQSLDIDYGVAVAKVAIETVYRLSNRQ